MKDKIQSEACKKLIGSMLEALRALDVRTRHRLALHNYDLSPEQVLTLFAIHENEGFTMTELAHKVLRDKTTITRMIDGLEKINMVFRIPDKRDRRRLLIYQTPEGKRRVNEVKSWRPTIPEMASGTLSSKELLRAQKVVAQFAQNLLKE